MTASSNMNIESKVGWGPIKPAQGIYEESATAKADLGTRIQVGDRTFMYAYAGGTALVAGTLVAPANWIAGTLEVNLTVGTAASVGTYKVPNITSAAAQTALAGGYMVVNDVAGQGQCYKIKSSSANADTSTSTDLVLYDPIETALTTSSQVELYCSPYYDLDITGNVTDHIVGVPPIAVTASYYFWLQTWGPCGLLVGATTAAGDLLVPHTTDGSVAPGSVFTSNIVGFALTAGTATEFNGAFLRLVP
jgi:hypothetical protein